MSQVEYRCPKRVEGCGSRHFDEPGGTKFKCRWHDLVMDQVEEYHGATFEYIEDSTGHSRTGRATHLKTHSPTPEHPDILKNIKTPQAQVPKVVESPQVIMHRLRERYYTLYGKVADKRWGEAKLRTRVAEKEAELEAISAKVSAEMKAASDEIDRQREANK